MNRAPALADIKRSVAQAFGVALVDIDGPSRRRRFAWPRQAAMFIARRRRPDLSYPRIGLAFGGRDHTTVLHAIRAAEARRHADPEFAAVLDRAEHAALLPPSPLRRLCDAMAAR